MATDVSRPPEYGENDAKHFRLQTTGYGRRAPTARALGVGPRLATAGPCPAFCQVPCCVRTFPPNDVADALGERDGPPGIAKYHKDGVVSGDSAHHVRKQGPVDGNGRRIRLRRRRLEDHELLDAVDLGHRIRNRPRHRPRGAGRRDDRPGRALIRPVSGAFDEAELLDIPRNRRLRGSEPGRMEPLPELFLVPNGLRDTGAEE